MEWKVILLTILLGIICFCLLHWYYEVPLDTSTCVISFLWFVYVGWVLHMSSTNYSVSLSLFFGTILWMGATIDKHFFILPDEGAICLFLVGYLRLLVVESNTVSNYIPGFLNSFLLSLLQCITLGFFFYLLRVVSKGGMGWGDIKWAAAISVWLTPFGIYLMLSVSFITGAIYGVFKRKRKGLGSIFIPFGPFLALGGVMAYIWLL